MPNITYLVGVLTTIILWLVLFIYRKDARREMLFISISVAVLGLFMEAFFWTKDWWRPPTITNTLVGIEDIGFGFGLGGIAAVIYEELFKRKCSKRKKTEHPHAKQLLLLILLSVIIGNTTYFLFDLNSAQSWVLAIIAPTLIIWLLRPDLIIDSLMTGVIITFLAFLGFAVLNWLEPNFVYKWWLLKNLSGIIFLGVPLEDIIWFFATGIFIGPIYEFWQGYRLQKLTA